MKEIIKQMNIENLPKRGLFIDWWNCKNHKVNFIYGDIKDEIEIVEYDGKHLHIKYLEEYDFKILPGDFKRCKIGKLLKTHTSDFKYKKEKRIVDAKRDITIVNMEYRPIYSEDGTLKHNYKWYNYKCNKCGWTEGWIIEEGLKNDGCACCASKIPVLGINTIWDTDKWMIPIINDEEFCKTHTHCTHDEIYLICPDCLKIKNKKIKISTIYAYGCSCLTCGDGQKYPNKFAHNLLEQLNIDFESEYSPQWIKPKRYDFYFKLDKILLY